MPSPFEPPLSLEEVASQFEDLNVIREVKPGGQGTTFEALRKVDGQRAALKIYSAATDPERVQREIEKLLRINSPHVMKVLHRRNAEFRGKPVIAVEAEWIDGEDLASLATSALGQSIMSESEVKRLLIEGATGIEALFAQDVVHRDINPNNVMRRADGSFVLIDLGYAKHLDRSSRTAKGTTFGTLGYISPELINMVRPSYRSDLFSLAAVAYLMASGVHPFDGDQNQAGTFKYEHIDEISPFLNNLLQRLMSSIPVVRAKSCEEIRQLCASPL
jgi:serine/threonine-protein kinase